MFTILGIQEWIIYSSSDDYVEDDLIVAKEWNIGEEKHRFKFVKYLMAFFPPRKEVVPKQLEQVITHFVIGHKNALVLNCSE